MVVSANESLTFFIAEMSSDDEVMSWMISLLSSESSESGEFEMVSIVPPYANEPSAHSSDKS